MGMTFFTKKWKTVYIQGFWPKSVYLKCFGNQLKTVYLQVLLKAVYLEALLYCEKKFAADYEQLLRIVFLSLQGQFLKIL
jgi:hypothetical protein